MEKVKDAIVLREKIDYKDKTTGENKSFNAYFLCIKGHKVKCVPNKDQLTILEELGKVETEPYDR